MSIRKKTLYIATLTVLVLIAVLYIITRVVLLDKFELLQEKEAEKNMLRISEALGNMQSNLNSNTRDWSSWDETYNYINGNNPGFTEINATQWVFENLSLNFMIFIDNEGNILYKKFFDLANLGETAFPEGLLDYFDSDSILLKHENLQEGNTGIINISSGTIMLSSQPILKSDESGPEAGSLIWGFYIDDRIAQKLSDTLHIGVEVINIKPQDGDAVSADDQTDVLLSKFKAGTNIYLENVDGNNIAGNLLFNGISGKPAFIIRSIMPREIYNQGEESLNWLIFLISMAIAAAATAFTIIIGKTAKNYEAKLIYMAHHDELTGIPSRRFLEDMLVRAIAKAKRGRKSFLIFFDVDNFKFINNTYGHHFGDKILIGISSHLQKTLRKEDLLARFGGDEFIVLLEHDDIIKAKGMAERLRTYINQFDMDIGSENFHFSVSMGLTAVEPDESVNEILARADRAMHLAKENGKDQLVALEREFNFSPTDELVLRLKKALKEGLFRVYYQPIIKLSSNKIVFYEALSRLEDGLEPAVTPDVFIPVMERFGLIGELTRFVFGEIIIHLKNDPEKCIFMNLSAKCFSDKSILNYIKNNILESNAGPRQFGFEITETAMLNDILLTKEWITNIKKMGCRFAIDDFGTGFTSFNTLKELPVDFYKIDGKIIKNINKDLNGAAMVKSVKLLADLLGKETIAEWVENIEIEKTVKSIGIGYGQGYYYAKPQPEMKSDDSINKKLAENQDRSANQT